MLFYVSSETLVRVFREVLLFSKEGTTSRWNSLLMIRELGEEQYPIPKSRPRFYRVTEGYTWS